jgi:hypothetical protein
MRPWRAPLDAHASSCAPHSPSSMNIRIGFLVCATLPLMLAGGCTTAYKNAAFCKDKMLADYPDAATSPLRITESKEAIGGARVVVRGEITSAPTPQATKGVIGSAAMECTFNGDTLSGFQWLSPPVLAAKKPAPPARE